MEIDITLTGVRPMIQHNGRLANQLDPYTRRLAAITKKTKKTDEDWATIMQIESRGSCWETPDGILGVPTEAVWRSLYNAATAFKRGEDIKRSLLFDDEVRPLLVDGEQVTCDDFLRDPENVFLKVVVIGRNRTMRARPRVPTGWQTTHRFELLTDVIDARNLAPILERAGRLVGIGDWRPRYGRYEIAIKEVARLEAAA